jgi:3-methylcrotonyl-CoA carboxylase alpha subunit
MFEKILIANRGEIACRIIKSARALGIASVAVYSEADKFSRHVRCADEAVNIGPAPAAESYLNAARIIEVARQTGAQAIHPGYGFLSENAEFARLCEKNKIKFIGPSYKSIEAMGLKDKAKQLMEKAGVPVVPGYNGADQSLKILEKQAATIGFPLLIKASAGGGGKGMRLVSSQAEFKSALESCKREAKSAFDNDHVLLEKFIEKPRHIEVQVFGDGKGGAVHLFERDCSLQRRHQKVVEEAPAPLLGEEMREKMGKAAVQAVKALSYENAGTIEFIVDQSLENFYFMEMNTRLQVEHPVTEMVTGFDLVEWQLRIASGEGLPASQDEISLNGHAFEVRLYAEDPAHEFVPQTGRIKFLSFDETARNDTGVDQGDTISIFYDPMIAKIIVHGADRKAAFDAMSKALETTELYGLNTNQEFLRNIFAHPLFAKAQMTTAFIDENFEKLVPENYGRPVAEEIVVAAAYYLKGLNLGPAGRDPWDERDSFRMEGALTRPLSMMCGSERIDIMAQCFKDHFVISYDGKSYEASAELDRENHFINGRVNNRTFRRRFFASGRDLVFFDRARVLPFHLYIHGTSDEDQGGEGKILTPMPGKIIEVLVKKGDQVDKNQPLLIMEAMKMEMTIRAGCKGIIEELPFQSNDQVQDGALLVSITPPEGS